MEPAVFLDRDNTLIANDGDLGDPDEVRLLDGVPAGLRALREAGYRLVVVTNQGGVARGRYTERDVDAVHRRIVEHVKAACGGQPLIERFYYCPFHPEGTVSEYRREHPWRKPGPGMLFQAAADLELDLARSWLIGDRPRDVEAGQAAGCRTIMIGRADAPAEAATPTATAESFTEAVHHVLRSTPPREPVESGGASAAAEAGGAAGAEAPTGEIATATITGSEAPTDQLRPGPIRGSEAPTDQLRPGSARGSEAPTDQLRPDATRGAEAPTDQLRPGPTRGSEAAPDAQRRAVTGSEAATDELPVSLAEAKPLPNVVARPAPPRQPRRAADDETAVPGGVLHRALRDLTDELRLRRQRDTEFTALRMSAGITQLLVLLLALLGLLQLGDGEQFLKWMVGAVLLQLFTVTLLLADLRG